MDPVNEKRERGDAEGPHLNVTDSVSPVPAYYVADVSPTDDEHQPIQVVDSDDDTQVDVTGGALAPLLPSQVAVAPGCKTTGAEPCKDGRPLQLFRCDFDSEPPPVGMEVSVDCSSTYSKSALKENVNQTSSTDENKENVDYDKWKQIGGPRKQTRCLRPLVNRCNATVPYSLSREWSVARGRRMDWPAVLRALRYYEVSNVLQLVSKAPSGRRCSRDVRAQFTKRTPVFKFGPAVMEAVGILSESTVRARPGFIVTTIDCGGPRTSDESAAARLLSAEDPPPMCDCDTAAAEGRWHPKVNGQCLRVLEVDEY